jgi:hypothetical protein
VGGGGKGGAQGHGFERAVGWLLGWEAGEWVMSGGRREWESRVFLNRSVARNGALYGGSKVAEQYKNGKGGGVGQWGAPRLKWYC